MNTARPALLIVTELFPTQHTSSFAGSFVINQIHAVEAWYDVHVLVPYPVSLLEELRKPIAFDYEHDGIHVHYAKYFSIRLIGLRVLLQILPILHIRELHKKIEKAILAKCLNRQAVRLHAQFHFRLVHGHELLVGDEAAPIGTALGIPSVITLHSLASFLEYLRIPAIRKRIVANLSIANTLVTVSFLAKSSYSTITQRPITVIPNCYTLRSCGKLPQSLQRYIKDRVVFFTAGFFIPTKRPQAIVRAAAALRDRGHKNFIIVLAGTGPLQQMLESMISSLGVAEFVYLEGIIDPANLPAYYRSADVIVQPSISESFSMICLEAMAYGKPFLCTENAGIAEYIHDGKEGFIIAPDNEEALVERMGRLLTDPGLRSRMGADGKIAAERFTEEHVGQELHTLYASLMPSQP